MGAVLSRNQDVSWPGSNGIPPNLPFPFATFTLLSLDNSYRLTAMTRDGHSRPLRASTPMILANSHLVATTQPILTRRILPTRHFEIHDSDLVSQLSVSTVSAV